MSPPASAPSVTTAAATGVTLHVGGAAASAAGDGSAASPFATLAAAVAAVTPGGRILLRRGAVVAGGVTVPAAASGRPGRPVWLTAEAGAVLTTAATGLAWTPAGGGVHVTTLPRGTPRVTMVVDDGDGGGRVFPAASRAAVATAAGCWHDTDSGRLYVRLPSGRAPGAGVRVATADVALRVEASDWVVSGLAVSVANRAGVEVVRASRVWVINNTVASTGDGVVVRGGFAGAAATADANVVADNTLTETGVFGWAWAAVKGGPAERSGVRVTGTAARTLVRGNTIRGFFNGVYVGSFDAQTNAGIARQTDVVGNTIREVGDDGLEAEGACVGVAALDNTLTNVRTGVSVSPVTRGPVYVVRTIIGGYAVSAVKVNNAPTGRVFLYHTTAIPGGGARRGGGGASAQTPAQAFTPSVPFGGLVAVNNLFLSDGYCIEMSWAGRLLGDGAVWDYNAWSCRVGDGAAGAPWFKWRAVRHATLADLTAATGQEAHGVAAPSRLLLEAGYTPPAGSVVIDAGVRLPGINDGRAAGGRVDIGAVERSV